MKPAAEEQATTRYFKLIILEECRALWGEPEDCKSIRDHENVDEFDENIKMSMMPSYGKLVAKDPEAENYQPPVLDHSNT